MGSFLYRMDRAGLASIFKKMLGGFILEAFTITAG
jgi:hypothetical protein